jgi:glycosyltransferase involved in cell wall biosynthesis
MTCSVLILTLNEEINIAECIDSVSWSDDIVVFDSHSSDRTIEIAESKGARIVKREFDNWSAHQNWAVSNIDFAHDWVFYIDADERCDGKLVEELTALQGQAGGCAAYQVRRKDYFMGRWLKHAQLYPTWITRVFRPETIRYERLVNPVAVVEGQTGALDGHLIHYPFSHGVQHWVARHNRYSDMEARDLLQEVQGKMDWGGLFSGDKARRRRAMKTMAYRMPCRPTLMYLYLLFVRGAFLDGRPGLTYCRLRAFYEYLIDLKVKEIRRRGKGLSI